MKRLVKITLLALALVLVFTGFAFADELAAGDVKAIKPEDFKAASYSYTKIKCSWEKIAGVDGYIVYRGTSKNGKYEKVWTVEDPEKTSYINTNRTTGKTYFYKLRAYAKSDGKTVYTKYSDIDCAYARPSKVKGLDVYGQPSGINGVHLDWKAVTGATGYQPQVNEYKDGKWTGWRTYSIDEDGDKQSFWKYEDSIRHLKKRHPEGFVLDVDLDTKKQTKIPLDQYIKENVKKNYATLDIVEDDTVYKFRVRAYHTENGKKIYGAWSEAYTLTENINMAEILAELRQFAINYAAEHNPNFTYDDENQVPPEEGSFTIDGAFPGFSKYANRKMSLSNIKKTFQDISLSQAE